MIPFLRLTVVWISGIILAIYYRVDLSITLVLLCALITLYIGAFKFIKSRLAPADFSWLNPIGLLILLVMSYGNVLLHVIQKQQNSLTVWLSGNQHLEGYQVHIEKVYKASPYSCKASVTHIRNHSGWHSSSGYLRLYFSKKDAYEPTKGHTLLIRGTPVRSLCYSQIPQAHSVISLHNTNQPMYHHTLHKMDKDFIHLLPQKSKQNSICPVTIRQWCTQILTTQLQDAQAIAMVETLLFGQKDRLNPAIRKAYTDTGTIHVLAVSGLHVTMLYTLIGAVFRFFFTKMGFFTLSEICTIFALWLYSWLCSFSPPVVRATTMITMARLAFLIRRGPNRYNGLFFSAFALLIWNPCLLLHWGFQLSYMATLGILYLQPPIHSVITVKNYWLQKIWASTSLSIAAQISTLPLILHYFKQFPLYFIIANWAVVPAIFMILILSLALLVGSYLPIVDTLLGFTLTKLIFATNTFVCWMAQWPMSTLQNCSVKGYEVCLLYLILISICLFLKYKNLIYPLLVTVCIACYAAGAIQSTIAAQRQCKLICYHNHSLSFTLQDHNRDLTCHNLQPIHKVPYLQRWSGGIMAAWHGKVILAIGSIPSDWYSWRDAKIEADYLLIEQKLSDEVATLGKVFKFKTLIIYSDKANQPRDKAKIKKLDKKLGIDVIWLRPGMQKILTWSTKQ